MNEPESTAAAALRCPACSHEVMWQSGVEPQQRLVCDRCGCCWDSGAIPWMEIDSIACPGCPQRFVCESRPTTAVVDQSRVVQLDDGTRILIRPLVAGDRSELAHEYDRLSAFSRRRRFFSPPKRLSASMLEYLTNLDGSDRFALIAYSLDSPTPRGIGVARWVRDSTNPTVADAAVTVADHWQRRGVGTELLKAMIDEAAARGIEVFAADVLWENEPILAPARALGARIRPSEPGVARIEFDLPPSSRDVPGTAVHHFFSVVARTPPDGTSI